MDPTSIAALRQHLQAETGRPVALIETHISWVLLTEDFAYKLKKPVRLPFVDFSTLALRKHCCDEELRLNRRLAPALYLRVVPVSGSAEAPRLDGAGTPIDHAVCMRRFAPGALLSERLTGAGLLPEHLDGLAERIAAFHRDAAIVPAPAAGDATARVLTPILRVLAQLRDPAVASRIDALQAWCLAQAERWREMWAAREREGCIRDGHGDLHLANTALIDGAATAFDCIDFDPALRCIDVLSDIAFLTMDLKAHGRSDLAYRFLDVYLQHRGDYAGVPVLRLYEVYRALVRALANRLRAPHLAPDAPLAGDPDYLACAEALAREAGGRARLLITCGVSGSGKSTVARQWLAESGAIRLRSDVERKRLFGLTALERSTDPARVYSTEATRRTYERLAQLARPALLAGCPVIVDAAFLRRSERDAFRSLAAEHGVPFTILHCSADAATLRARVAARAASGHDASEADLQVLERQLRSSEPLAPDERPFVIEVMSAG